MECGPSIEAELLDPTKGPENLSQQKKWTIENYNMMSIVCK